MQKTKIDWGIPNLWTWNPITGCKRGCSYCYARKIHNRFNKTSFSEIVLHENRLYDKTLGDGKTIFVGSMSDIFYWSQDQKKIVLERISHYPDDTFMFLTKDPSAYRGIVWPKNCMQGVTLTLDYSFEKQFELIEAITSRHLRPFFSVEPLLGTLDRRLRLDFAEKIIVGAMTGRGAVEPKKEWIQSIRDNVPEEKIFWKPSIRMFL